jgi:hypothetical protein
MARPVLISQNLFRYFMAEAETNASHLLMQGLQDTVMESNFRIRMWINHLIILIHLHRFMYFRIMFAQPSRLPNLKTPMQDTASPTHSPQ